MKKVLVTGFMILLVGGLPAQIKPRFSTQNTVGLLVGGADNAPQVQTVNGVAYHNWFTGIGTGIDWYYQRSIPLFLSANRYFNLTPRRQLFLASGAGANFPWGEPDLYSNGWGSDYRFVPGLYWTAGFGYRISIGKQNDKLMIQLGYNNKTHKQELTTVYPCFNPPCPESKESFRYKLNALSLKLGWGF